VIVSLIEEAVAAGARLARACGVVGLSARTLQRWKLRPDGEDRRTTPRFAPPNALSGHEIDQVVKVMASPLYANLSPKQLVPLLADQGLYLASESTMYRLRRRFGLCAPKRSGSRDHITRASIVHNAAGPNQVWSWDITYLPTPVRGRFLHLYLVMDVWSRRIMGWDVLERETSEAAAAMFLRICDERALDPKGLVLHSDNGIAMRGNVMVATLQRLGVIPSFSRYHVSNDNAYSEALFRTLKYTPAYPRLPFADAEAARCWVERFVAWYNTQHRHSAIRYVTPDERHSGREDAILTQRQALYARARRANPERWTRATRNWTPVGQVTLNPQQPNEAAA
jgi:transposase InsO family protein